MPDDDEGSWKTLRTADEIVEYYTPDELLDRLADRLGVAYPHGTAVTGIDAVRLLAVLAQRFAQCSRDRERELIEQFEVEAASLAELVGDVTIADDEDERLAFGADGHFSASVVPRDQPGVWRSLHWPDELVEFYDPVDLFADLAEAIGEAHPSEVVPASPSEGS